ncbi:MAG: lipoprotein signal peptidase [Chitinophagaceae bacterium]
MKKACIPFLIVFLLLVIDQSIKIWVKTHFYITEEYRVFGSSWCRILFIENEGMAYGLKWGGQIGKFLLTFFRFIACVWGFYYLYKISQKKIKKYNIWFILCVMLILAGAMGNLIDSLLYGLIFNESSPYALNIAKLFPESGGYSHFMFGNVVDMFYFPMVQTHWPAWVPWVGGSYFEFFSPVFNFADSCVTVGAVILLFGQKKFFKNQTP